MRPGWSAAYRSATIAFGSPATAPSVPAASSQNNIWAERFIKTMLAEWAYGKLYRSNQERLAALPRWVDFYNRRRSHTALDGAFPMDVLVNHVCGNHT